MSAGPARRSAGGSRIRSNFSWITAAVPKRFMIGQRGDGLRQILTTLSIGRILVAATALGLAPAKAIDLARAYGANRTVSDEADFTANQGVTFPLADMLTKIHAAELMVRNAALLADAGRPFRTETSMVKLFASELASEAADAAVQVHGGYGVFEESEVSGLIGEARVLRLVEGTSEIQRLIIARELAA